MPTTPKPASTSVAAVAANATTYGLGTPTLVLPFLEGAGASIADYSGNANDGTLTNFPASPWGTDGTWGAYAEGDGSGDVVLPVSAVTLVGSAAVTMVVVASWDAANMLFGGTFISTYLYADSVNFYATASAAAHGGISTGAIHVFIITHDSTSHDWVLSVDGVDVATIANVQNDITLTGLFAFNQGTFPFDGKAFLLWISNATPSAPDKATIAADPYLLLASPGYTAAGTSATGGAASAGSGAFAPPVYSGAGASTVGGVASAGVGAVPAYTASGASTVGGTASAGVAGFVTPVYSGAGAAAVGGVASAGAATFAVPVYTATGTCTVGGVASHGTNVLPFSYLGTPGLTAAKTMRVAGAKSMRIEAR